MLSFMLNESHATSKNKLWFHT